MLRDFSPSPTLSLPDHYSPPSQCERYTELLETVFPMLQLLGVKASLQPILLFKVVRIGREFFKDVSS